MVNFFIRGVKMQNRLKTRFDYDNPETCMLATSYAIETGLCPECKTSVTIKTTLDDGDILIALIECPKCKIKLEWGSILDNSPEANELRQSFGLSYVR